MRLQIIKKYVETLRVEAHKLGTHGLSEEEFYRQGILRGAVEQMRGVYSATMRDKRAFIRHILNHMQDAKLIKDWESSGAKNRYDYLVHFDSGRIAGFEAKGCLDGANTTIFEVPQQANEFVIWSICTNPTSDPRHNTWSGIHTRLSADIISNQKRVDGIVIWDMLCGTLDRPCPKVAVAPDRVTEVAQFKLPPRCIYVFPGTKPHARNNLHPVAQKLEDVLLLQALHNCFGGRDDEVNYVDFDVEHRNQDTVRRTRILRGGVTVRESKFDVLRRS